SDKRVIAAPQTTGPTDTSTASAPTSSCLTTATATISVTRSCLPASISCAPNGVPCPTTPCNFPSCSPGSTRTNIPTTMRGPRTTSLGSISNCTRDLWIDPGCGCLCPGCPVCVAAASTTSTSIRSTSTPVLAPHWLQCGGIGWSGPTACESPYTC